MRAQVARFIKEIVEKNFSGPGAVDDKYHMGHGTARNWTILVPETTARILMLVYDSGHSFDELFRKVEPQSGEVSEAAELLNRWLARQRSDPTTKSEGPRRKRVPG